MIPLTTIRLGLTKFFVSPNYSTRKNKFRLAYLLFGRASSSKESSGKIDHPKEHNCQKRKD